METKQEKEDIYQFWNIKINEKYDFHVNKNPTPYVGDTYIMNYKAHVVSEKHTLPSIDVEILQQSINSIITADYQGRNSPTMGYIDFSKNPLNNAITNGFFLEQNV